MNLQMSQLVNEPVMTVAAKMPKSVLPARGGCSDGGERSGDAG